MISSYFTLDWMKKKLWLKQKKQEKKSCGVSFGPEPSDAIVLFPILQVLSGNGTDQRVSRITIRQQGADGEQHFGDGKCRRPVILQYIQADNTLTVDIAVIDPRPERHLLTTTGKDTVNHQAVVFQKTTRRVRTLGGLNGYSGEKWMSRKKTPPS